MLIETAARLSAVAAPHFTCRRLSAVAVPQFTWLGGDEFIAIEGREIAIADVTAAALPMRCRSRSTESPPSRS